MERILASIRAAQRARAGLGVARPDLLRGQKPELLLLACSDSRVVPTTITGSEPGRVFVVRNAGNIVPPPGIGSSEEGSIEYGVEVLGIRDIVICGHTRCGAVEALIMGAKVPAAVARWIDHAGDVRAKLDACCPHGDHVTRWDQAVQLHLAAQIDRVHSYPVVQRYLPEGLQVHGWVYDIATAELSHYDPGAGSLTPVGYEQVG